MHLECSAIGNCLYPIMSCPHVTLAEDDDSLAAPSDVE